MRINGLIVDSTSHKHLGIDGLPGTQSLYSGTKDIQFKMILRDAIMVLPHRLPTDDDILNLPRFHLTQDAPWVPGHHYDDLSSIDIQDTHSYHTAAECHVCHLHHLPTCPTRYQIHRND
jgi:hypothetical protein